VHDFEDAIVNGFIDPALLAEPTHRDEVLHTMVSWVGDDQAESLGAAWNRLSGVAGWVSSFQPQRAELARLKNLTSTLIGRFALSAFVDDARKTLVVPPETAAEIAVLKGIVSVHVMSHTARQPIYLAQRTMLIALAEHLYSHPESLDPVFASDWAVAVNADAKKRVVVDQVASLTDQSATVLHERLCS
jgi:dGTPase